MPKKIPQSKYKGEVETWKDAKPKVTFGQVVFGFVQKPWWPGVVVTEDVADVKPIKPHHEWVFWYGDNRMSEVPHNRICNFKKHYQMLVVKGSKKYHDGLKQAIDNCALQEITGHFSAEEKLKWASDGFILSPGSSATRKARKTTPSPSRNLMLTETVIAALEKIKSLIRAENEEDEGITNWDIPGSSTAREKIVETFIKPSLIKKEEKKEAVKIKEEITTDLYTFDGTTPTFVHLKTTVWDICLACRHKWKEVIFTHPYFDGEICDGCREDLKGCLFDLDTDGTKMTCTICANGGELIVCENKFCGRSYCSRCLIDLCGPRAVEYIKALNKWFCMFCREYTDADGALILQRNWPENITNMFKKPGKKETVKPKTRKTQITVFSLFDGISTAYHALSKLDLKIKAYFSFEANKDATAISKSKFFGKIIYLEEVEKLTYEVIKELQGVDLIVGTSTFRDPRFGNASREDVAEHHKNFYEFYRVWTTANLLNIYPIYWVYSCVATVPYDFVRIINRFFGSEPFLMDAMPTSSKYQPSFWWGNIPNMSVVDTVIPKERLSATPAVLQITQKEKKLKKLMESSSKAFLPKHEKMDLDAKDDGKGDTAITELEEDLGLPIHATDVGNLTPKQRLRLLGNVISVPTAVNVFSSLRELFETKEI